MLWKDFQRPKRLEIDTTTLEPRYGRFIAGGAALAGLAGYVNLVLLGFFHVPVSHMTGAVSRLGADVASGDDGDLLLVAGMVAGFLIGCAASGLIIGSRDLGPGRRYGVALMVEGALLAASCLLALGGHQLAIPLAATACGVSSSADCGVTDAHEMAPASLISAMR